MKHISCPSPQCRILGAMLPPSRAFPQGEPAFTGQYVSEFRCARCGVTSKISAADYAKMPELALPDFGRLAKTYQVPALEHMPTKDLEGCGLKREHAKDLFCCGIQTAHDVAEEERKNG